MATVNLLDINVDSLFEQHSISEIDQLHKNLQSCIEGKKEELRMMVGERYRDLLQAADTIGHMKTTSRHIIEQIDDISSTCHDLNDKQLIGFKVDIKSPTTMPRAPNTSDLNKNVVNHYYGCVAQIHLLTILPELIWSHLDDGDYCAATQLFMLSRHISTGLQLDSNNDIMTRFPMARQQWNNLNQFYFTIKNLCLEELEKPEVSPKITMKCLASLMLLENCEIAKILLLFIQLRTKAFRKVLNVDDNVGFRKKLPSVKDRLISSISVLVETVTLLYKCFVATDSDDDVENYSLPAELKRITDASGESTISLIHIEDFSLKQYLPALISKFKPQVQFKAVDKIDTKKTIDVWLNSIRDASKKHLKTIIDNIGSIRTIHNISQTFLKLEKPKSWDKMLQALQLPNNLDFYGTYYQPLILERIKTIIQSMMIKTNDEAKTEICNVMDTLDDDWTMSKSFWNEEFSDNPLSLKQALDTNKQNHKLLMKTKGFTAKICGICELIDKNFEILYNDLYLYLTSMENDYTIVKHNEVDRQDQLEITKYLRDCTQQNITELISRIKEMTGANDYKKRLIFLTRFFGAIKLICPYMKLCLTQATLTSSTKWNDAKISNLEHWERICSLIDEEALLLWKQWITHFVNEILLENQKYCFAVNIDMMNAMNVLSNWETIQVQEKDDKDASVQSQIRVPCQPSIALQQFLYKCSKQLCETVPSALSQAVIMIIKKQLIGKLIETYDELHQNKFVSSNQNISIQYYFDLKLLNFLFLPEHRDENMSALIGKFKNNIDPFDFELFHKYLNNNIKLSAYRCHQQHGLLISNKTHLNSISSNVGKQSVSTHDKDPNVMALSINSTQKKSFTLLPVVVSLKASANIRNVAVQEPSLSNTTTARREKRKSPTKATIQESMASSVSATQQNLANVKSNAAAFFGAMSQDWFR